MRICRHCENVADEHVGTKCLWEPSSFEDVQYLLCKLPTWIPHTTAVISEVRYYLCLSCNDEIAKKGRQFYRNILNDNAWNTLHDYLNNDDYVRIWIKSRR